MLSSDWLGEMLETKIERFAMAKKPLKNHKM